jgi:hypothetical protein
MDSDDIKFGTELPIIKNPRAQIWRYLTHEKYLDLLEERALFFPRADLFPDSIEGSYPDANRVVRDLVWSRINISDEQREIIEGHSKLAKALTYVSCWHVSEHESDAFWKIYAPTEKGIAIQSTVWRLRACLPDFIHIHPVTYLDYRRQRIPDGHSLYPFFFKTREYWLENELRAVTGDLPMSHPGRLKAKIIVEGWSLVAGWSFQIAPNELIEKVYVKPGCSKETLQSIEEESRQKGLTVPILRSALDAEPRY